MKRVFRVDAVWDAEAEVFYSRSDIDGFHIEASDPDEFQAIMMDVAPELIVSNHRTGSEDSVRSPEEPISVILWRQPGFEKGAG